jgi:linoleoyl-CoA desaturase
MSQLRFPARGEFHTTVKQRVEQYFTDSGRSTTGDWRLFVKTGVILAWLVGSYVLLVFGSTSLLVALLAVFALAQGCALVGFNIMHDGAHGSYAHSTTINRLMGGMLNVIGGSQMLWRHKHNRLHHIYTNIHTLDNDLQTNGLLRFSPQQPWHSWHRFQHYYAFAVYSLLTLSWVTIGDCRKLLSGRIGPSPLRQLTGTDVSVFCVSKMCYFGYALLLPLYFHPWLHVLLAFVGVHLLLGMTLSVVFQLAHTVEHTSFPSPETHTGMMPKAWAVHEVETTANFAPHNPWVTWYLGGLNFQIEHHLFARVCHIHYPALSTMVAETCYAFGLPYVCYPTVRSAIAAHYRVVKTMGRRPKASSSSSPLETPLSAAITINSPVRP